MTALWALLQLRGRIETRRRAWGLSDMDPGETGGM